MKRKISISKLFSATIELGGGDSEAISWHFGLLSFDIYGSWSNCEAESWITNATKRKKEKYGDGRIIGIKHHGGTFWFSLWEDPNMGCHDDPKWWKFNWTPIDFFFGGTDCHTEELEQGRIDIPMPEGIYPAKITMKRRTWTRPRLPFWSMSRTSAYVEPDVGVPCPGKGSMDYNCGQDGTYGWSVRVEDMDMAKIAGESVTVCMGNRFRYGSGFEWRPEGEEYKPNANGYILPIDQLNEVCKSAL